MEDYIEMLPLDPQWRCFFESDGKGGEGGETPCWIWSPKPRP